MGSLDPILFLISLTNYNDVQPFNLEDESRNTVVYQKYFQAQYLLNLPSTWGLGSTRICLLYFHLKLVESGNLGLNIFVLFAIDARNLSSINDLMFS